MFLIAGISEWNISLTMYRLAQKFGTRTLYNFIKY